MYGGGEEEISWLLCSPRFLFKLSEGESYGLKLQEI